jgi:multidrug efflux pump subunit AcrA (membrane-fusion protein)
MVMAGAPALAGNGAGEGEYFEVQQARGVPMVSIGGTVIPYKEVMLNAELPGRVKYLAGIEGDRFQEGTTLVALDETELVAKRKAALAQRNSAVAQLRNASVQYSREVWSPRADAAPGGMGIPNMFDQMFTKPAESMFGRKEYGAERYSDLYGAGVRVEEARNAIARLDAEIQQVDANLRKSKSVAPFAGVIITKFVEIGDTVQPGMPLLKYADVTYLQVEVDIPARLRPGLEEGAILHAHLDVNNLVVPVRVAQIYPMADIQRHTVKVKFDLPLDLPVGSAAPGMYSKVLVPDYTAPERSNPIIPTSAIRYRGSLPGVYVKDDDGKVELVLIRVGEPIQGGYTTVLSGLRAGEQVLRDPPIGISQDRTSGMSPAEGTR